MDAPEEAMIGGAMGPGEQSLAHTTNKGKRSKRPRPYDEDENQVSGNGNGNGNVITTTEEEEEEDTANCLIMLARGHFSHPPQAKYSSRRYLDQGNEVGAYVYQCKTCDKTFPCFQALGGHRASHKKPKSGEDHKRHLAMSSSDEEGQFLVKNTNMSSSLPLQLYNKNKGNKVHECSICGAEFTSGQALGGHMRRHRGLIIADHNQERKKQRNDVVSLDLDLNLPAPEDHQLTEESSKFVFGSNHQPSPLVLSAPAFVDCHY